MALGIGANTAIFSASVPEPYAIHLRSLGSCGTGRIGRASLVRTKSRPVQPVVGTTKSVGSTSPSKKNKTFFIAVLSWGGREVSVEKLCCSS